MALTDEEKRLLAQLEASLSEDDPELAQTLRGSRPRHPSAGRIALSIVGMLAGVALLIVGMQVQPLISVLGFLVMLAAVMVALGAGGHREPAHSRTQHPSRRGPRRPGRTARSNGDFMQRMEDRWRRRRDGQL